MTKKIFVAIMLLLMVGCSCSHDEHMMLDNGTHISAGQCWAASGEWGSMYMHLGGFIQGDSMAVTIYTYIDGLLRTRHEGLIELDFLKCMFESGDWVLWSDFVVMPDTEKPDIF